MAEIIEKENIAATVARESRKPFVLNEQQIAVPDGWNIKDTEALQAIPFRKKAKVNASDELSFVDYIKRHGSLASCTVWCEANYPSGKVDYTAIINDHEEEADGQHWRDHIAKFSPEKSVEWLRWNNSNTKTMGQYEFAEFIENNLADIASASGYPTGTAMLQMATALEITQDSRIKSAIRLQSGGVRMEYVQDDNAATTESMEVFNKFALGLPVFRGGDAYQLEARLKYRLNSGKLTFWYELNRADKVLEAAAKTLTQSIQEKSGFPLFHGNPFA
jgi:uncharacterized protein YfdQ (DUF2303 family)